MARVWTKSFRISPKVFQQAFQFDKCFRVKEKAFSLWCTTLLMPCQCISSKRCSNMTPFDFGYDLFLLSPERGTRGFYFILADFFVRRQASSNIIIIEGFGHQCGAGSAIFSQVEDFAAASPTTAWAPRNLGITPALSVFWNFHVVCFHYFS